MGNESVDDNFKNNIDYYGYEAGGESHALYGAVEKKENSKMKGFILKKNHGSCPVRAFSSKVFAGELATLNSKDSQFPPIHYVPQPQQVSLDLRSKILPFSFKKDGHSQVIILLENKTEQKKDKEKDYVTEKMIEEWNSQKGGGREKIAKAHRLIEMMRRRGGLGLKEREETKHEVDIPEARMALCLLAGLENQENKLYALDSLYEILKKDTYKKGEAVQLVDLAIKLLSMLHREKIQTLDVDAQIRIAKVYGMLMETILQHYARGHINAVTKELKNELIVTSDALKDLNRQKHPELKYHIDRALQGNLRLQSDDLKLLTLFKTVLNVVMGALALYEKDFESGRECLEDAFKEVNLKLKRDWYDATLIMNNLIRQIQYEGDNPDQLTPLLMFIGENKKSNWKFANASVEVLFDIALNGKTEKIRLRALTGIKAFGPDFPGLDYFVNFQELKSRRSHEDLVYKIKLKPTKVDYSLRIRLTTIKKLKELVKKSKDLEIVKRAEQTLKRVEQIAVKENDSAVLNILNESEVHEL